VHQTGKVFQLAFNLKCKILFLNLEKKLLHHFLFFAATSTPSSPFSTFNYFAYNPYFPLESFKITFMALFYPA